MRSNIVPSAVQTGCSKGWSETAQKLNGSRLKLAPALSDFRALAPADALKASSEDHSLWVIYEINQRLLKSGTISTETYVQFVSA